MRCYAAMSTSCLLQQQSAWPLKLPKKYQMLLVCNGCLQPNCWASTIGTIALDMVVAMALDGTGAAWRSAALYNFTCCTAFVQGTLPLESGL